MCVCVSVEGCVLIPHRPKQGRLSRKKWVWEQEMGAGSWAWLGPRVTVWGGGFCLPLSAMLGPGGGWLSVWAGSWQSPSDRHHQLRWWWVSFEQFCGLWAVGRGRVER